MSDKSESREKLLNILRDIIKQDADLRTQLQIGDKFRFVRDKLNALLNSVEEELTVLRAETEQPEVVTAEDDINVCVYLFNSQGLDMQSWRKMVSPDVFYEYSVNRPIYKEKEQIDKFIASKPTRTQHGYLIVAIKKDAIFQLDDKTKDAIGNPIFKVKEGSLKINRVVAFVHNSIEYSVSPEGDISKK